MAFRRSLTAGARSLLAQQRTTPSLSSYLNRHEDRKIQHSVNSFLQSRSYGVFSTNNNNTSLGFGGIRRSSLVTRDRLSAQERFTPSLSYLNNQHSDDKPKNFLQARSYGVLSRNNNNTSLGFGGLSTVRDPKWSQFFSPAPSGFLLARNMSIATNEGPKESDQTDADKRKEGTKRRSVRFIASIIRLSVIGCFIYASLYIVNNIIFGPLYPITIFCVKAYLCYWLTIIPLGLLGLLALLIIG